MALRRFTRMRGESIDFSMSSPAEIPWTHGVDSAKFLCESPSNANLPEGTTMHVHDPMSRIVDRCPRIFFQRLREEMDVAFSKAQKCVRERFDDPERVHMLGQARHAYCEEGFRRAARSAKLTAESISTRPAGGQYSAVTVSDVCLVRANIQVHRGAPRPTRFRKEYAACNRWLEPTQLNLLRDTPRPSPDALCAMLVVTAHDVHPNSDAPAFVGMGIPSSDLSGWMVLEQIDRLLGRYHDASVSTGPGTPVEIKDRAVPRLKGENRSGRSS